MAKQPKTIIFTESQKKEMRERVMADFVLNELYNTNPLLVEPTIKLIPSSGIGDITSTYTDLLKIGAVVAENYKVLAKLKQGGFGQIYNVRDQRSGSLAAIKVERQLYENRPNVEAHVLQKLQNTGHCPKLLAHGINTIYCYVVMQLLSLNLSDLRRQCPLSRPRFSIATAQNIIVQCIEATRLLHEVGFVHRDIKPANFAIGADPSNNMTVFMIDYGLSRYYVNKNGDHRTMRENVGFRGTPLYASVNAHLQRELSRRDDVYSLFYSYYEMITGRLPWTTLNSSEEIFEMKKNLPADILANDLPVGAIEFAKQIMGLEFEATPPYTEIIANLNSVTCRYRVEHELLDWKLTPNCKKNNHFDKGTIFHKLLKLRQSVTVAIGFKQ